MSNSNKNILPRQLGDSHIRLLKVFKTVIECGGFAAAEVELNISRPAISLAVSELESLLQMRLCNRGRSGFSITEHGKHVYQSTLQLLSSLELFKSQINAINTELVGDFNIGITDNLVTIPEMRITRALSTLKHRAPDIVINIRMMPPNDIESAILNGQLHIGVVPEFRTLPGLNYLPLYKEESLLYCSEHHHLFKQDLYQISDDSLYQYDAVVPNYPQSVEIKQQQKKLKATATSTDREGIAFLILTGRFIGFLPTHFAQRWVARDKLRAIEAHRRKFSTNFSVITSKGARSHLILEAYLEELAQAKKER
ncbi:LysR family transcriptional regulator [Thalassotalea castellviae]|uniref:LysR family transcriptional regulator n=1 Tax=Thalassotalea castellviae TaxID=3075612 RepID=A0ABU3A146_9GAMM|nr:LysR family transcriptional regulator [Thalassotalea sp. W431]MDT0603896.1 LysR family transcriptional regulator [Thalassotalea sp. W431]